jgi:hypothetical protein
MTDDFGFWCDICGKNDSAPHTPIDHPWLLKGHRLIPKPKVDEMVAAAIATERARILAAVEALPRYPILHDGGLVDAVIYPDLHAIIEGET